MGIVASNRCGGCDTGAKEDPLVLDPAIRRSLDTRGDDKFINTAWGPGKIIGQEGDIVSVKLGYATAFIHADQVRIAEPSKDWLSEKEKMAQQHQAEISKLQAMLSTFKEEKARLRLEADSARSEAKEARAQAYDAKAQMSEIRAQAEKARAEVMLLSESKEIATKKEIALKRELAAGTNESKVKEEKDASRSIASFFQWNAVDSESLDKFAGNRVYKITLQSCSTRTTSAFANPFRRSNSNSLFRLSSSNLDSISEAKNPAESSSKLERMTSEVFTDSDWIRGKHFVVTMVDVMGTILGRSAVTSTDKLLEPVYIVGGELDVPSYMFLELKQIKSKSKMAFKFSDMGYAYINVADEGFVAGEQRLRMYKKPTDFCRDPSKMRPLGYMTVDISLA